MGRTEHFNAGANPGGADYDENFPHPGDKPGRVEFGGRQLAATSVYKSNYSLGFTTPLENGAVAHVSYFPHQQMANVSLMHIQKDPGGEGVHTRMVGVVNEKGEDDPNYMTNTKLLHGERPPSMPRSPQEAVEDLDYYSKLPMPKHVQESNRKLLPKLRESWGWNPNGPS